MRGNYGMHNIWKKGSGGMVWRMGMALSGQLRLLSIYAVFTYPFVCIPFLFFFFRDHGISIQDYAYLMSFYYWAMVIMEIPTGLLADRCGRKLSLVLGPLALTLGFLIIFSQRSFAGFATGEVILGIGHSILSGPPTAMLFEILRKKGQEHTFLRQESRMQALRLAGTGLSFLAGGLLAKYYEIGPTILLTAGLSLVASMLALFLKDSRDSVADHKPPPLMRAAFKDLRSGPLLWILLYFMLIFGLLRYAFHTYQPFLEEAAIEKDWLIIGALFAGLNLVAAPCSRLVPRITSKIDAMRLLPYLPLVLALSLICMSNLRSWWGIAFFILHQIPFGMHWALVQNYVNMRIQNTARSTVLSVLSFGGRISFALWFPLAGAFHEDHGLTQTYLLVGCIGLVATGICVMLRKPMLRSENS